MTMLTGVDAQAQTWSGGAGAPYNWNAAGNWNAAVTPGTGTVLTFTGTTGLSNNNDFAAGSNFKQIVFNSAAGAFTLGGASLNLAPTSATTVIDNQSANDQVIGLGFNLTGSGDLRLNPGTGRKVTLGGSVGFGGQRFYLPSANVSVGTILFNAANTGTGNGNTFYNLTGALMRNTVYNATAGLTLEVGNKNAFGDSAATGLQMNANTTLRANTPLTSAASNALVNSVAVGNGATLTIGGSSALEIAGKLYGVGNFSNGVTFTNTGGTTISGNVYLTDQNSTSINPTFTFNVDANASPTAISGAIVNNSIAGNVSTGAVTKSGAGTLSLSGANTYTGTTTISAGSLYVNGTHSPTAATNSVAGVYSVTGTLGGSGAINPATNGTVSGGVMIDVLNNAFLIPGAANPDANADTVVDATGGMLTLNQATATGRSVLVMETGAKGKFTLGYNGTSTKVAIIGRSSVSFTPVYFNNTVLNFTDLTSGALTTGQYVLFSCDGANGFSGLTTSSGTITAGLSIGAGLESSNYTSKTLKVVGNNIVLDLVGYAVPTSGTIQAESYTAQSGTSLETTTDTGGGQDVTGISNGDYLKFDGINFGGGNVAMVFGARVASNTSGGNIEVRVDSTSGTLLGTIPVSNTGVTQTWVTNAATLTSITGTRNLFLVFTGGSGDLFNLNWFSLSPQVLSGPPAAPMGLQTVAGNGSVYLTWNGSTGATSYLVQRSTSSDFSAVTTFTTTGTTYTDTTAANGTTYYYRIVASNGANQQSSASSSTTGAPFDPAAINVVGVKIRAFNTYGMAVTHLAGVYHLGYWNNLVGPVTTGEVVSRGSSATTVLTNHRGEAVSGMVVTLTAGNTGFTSGNSGNTYTNSGTVKFGSDAVTVDPASDDANLFSSAFDQWDATASSLTVTGIPYSSYDAIFYVYDNGSTQGGTITANGSSLSVRGGSGSPANLGTGYVRSTDTAAASASTQQGNYVRFGGLSGNLTASLLAKNMGSSTQRLRIAGFQIVSNDAYVAPTQAPAAPTLTASGANQQVGLNWTAAPTATSYKIYKNGGLLTTVASPLSSYADAPVANGTAASYAVSAVNAVGEGSQSAPASATPSAPSFTPEQRTVYQWSLPMAPIYSTWTYDTQRRAYLWVPPTCTKVQGVVVGLHNMLEKPFFDDPAIRQACADSNLAILFIAPGDGTVWSPNGVGNYTSLHPSMAINLDPNNYYSPDIVSGTATTPTTTVSGTTYYSTDINPATGTRFATQSEQAGAELAALLTKFAAESGYSELQNAPVLLTDHSAASTFLWTRTVPTSAALNGRVIAILPYKGTFPGNLTSINSASGASLQGIPILHVAQEWQEINSWGNSWELGDTPSARSLRGGGANCLLGECIHPGTGHYEHAPEQPSPVVAFIKGVASARIPSNWSPTAKPTLNTLDPTSGYLVDVTKLGETTAAAPVAYNTWVSAGKDPLRAYWYPDFATAQAVCDAANTGFAKKPQMLTSYANSTTTTPTSLASLTSGGVTGVGYVPFGPTLLADGITFQVRAASVNQSPVVRLYHGAPLGISSGPILFRANGSGSLKQTGVDTFRVWLDRSSVIKGGQPWEPFILAYQAGDSNYRSAYRPIQLLTGVPVNQVAGAAQTINFPAIPNQVATNLQPLTLSATATSGKSVQFWVASGPYRVDETSANGQTLVPDAIPPKTKLPMRVVVGAWQWGAGGYQSAPAVFNEFWIGLTPVNLSVAASGGTPVVVTDLLSNTGIDPSTVSSVMVNSATAQGGTVTRNGGGTSGTIIYTPPSNFSGTDSFTYTITLAAGGASTWTANVSVSANNAPSQNITKMEAVGNGMHVQFYGVPGLPYRVEYTNSLTAPITWINAGTATETVPGQYDFTDTPPQNTPSRFYRAVYP